MFDTFTKNAHGITQRPTLLYVIMQVHGSKGIQSCTSPRNYTRTSDRRTCRLFFRGDQGMVRYILRKTIFF